MARPRDRGRPRPTRPATTIHGPRPLLARLQYDQIRTFLQVIRSGGMSRAADAPHATQFAVTARIRGLEENLGAVLPERTPAGVRLTRRGEILLRHARALEERTEAVERDAADPAAAEALIRIGGSRAIVQTLLPDFVDALHHRAPRLTIELAVDVSAALPERLLEGRLDLALLLGPLSLADAWNVTLPDVPLTWCAAPRRARDGTAPGPNG